MTMTTATTVPLMSFNEINVIYNQGQPNQVHALKDVSGTIREGEFISIIGRAGVENRPCCIRWTA